MTQEQSTIHASGALRLRWLWLVWILGAAVAVLQAQSLLQVLDADEATNSLAALRLLRGELPTWLGGQSHLGALKAYLDAPLVALLGPTEAAVRVSSLLFRIADVGVVMAAVLLLLGRRAALLAGVLAGFFGPLLGQWLLGGYNMGLSVLLWHLTILGVALALRGRRPVGAAVMAGLCAGLAVWNSPQALVVVGPALAGYVACAAARRVAALAGAFLAGSAPMWIDGLRHGFLGDIGRHVGHLPPRVTLGGRLAFATGNWRYHLGALFERVVSLDLLGDAPAPALATAITHALHACLLGAYVIFAVLLLRRRERDGDAWFWRLLVPGVVGLWLAGVGFTGPGTVRGSIERYDLPVLCLLPLVVAYVSRARPWLGVALTAALALPAVVGLAHVGRPYPFARVSQEELYAGPDAEGARQAVLRQIEAREATYLMGGFWDIGGYPFWTAERVAVVPIRAGWRQEFTEFAPPQAGNGLLLLRDGTSLAAFLDELGAPAGMRGLPAPRPWRLYLLPALSLTARDPARLFTTIVDYRRELGRFQRGEVDAVELGPGLISDRGTRFLDPAHGVSVRGGRPGVMVFGPYVRLPAGNYELELRFGPSPGDFEVRADVVTEVGSRTLWETTRQLPAEGGVVEGAFTTDGGEEHETRVFIVAGQVVLAGVRLSRSPSP